MASVSLTHLALKVCLQNPVAASTETYYPHTLLAKVFAGVHMTFEQTGSPKQPLRSPQSRIIWILVIILVLICASLAAALINVQNKPSSDASSVVDLRESFRAGFGSNSMSIVDQLGTANVDVWVRNIGRETKTATCAVFVVSGKGINSYRGSMAFKASPIAPGATRHFTETVPQVSLDGDMTAPIGSSRRPIPWLASLNQRSSISCM